MDLKFAHLHLHTEFSLLDGSGKIKDIIKQAKNLNMDHIAITDHGTMYGAVDFYKEAKKEGIKPIIGCEVYVASKDMNIKTVDKDNKTYHLVLLVKDDIGYKNLMKIVSKGSLDGFYYKPRVDHAYLREHSEGLICLSACLGGEVQSYFNHGQNKKAKETALIYKDIFGEDYYLELQDHGILEQKKVNKLNIDLARELDIKLVATNDVHYLKKDDAKAHDVLLCIQTGQTIDEEKRMKFQGEEFYLKSKEEMYNIFDYIPEALENTIEVANKCNFDYEFHVSKLPKFPLDDEVDPFLYLKEKTFEGMVEKYDYFKRFRNKKIDIKEIEKTKNLKETEIINRLNFELDTINSMGYVDYFLIVWDFIKYANDNNIATGAGRGSAAGSVVSYALNITKIDPIKYNLLFERFLNPERVSMPDIDSDFCYERRGEVIDYVVEKYGEKNVAQIITFGTMAARAAIRDVGRAMNYPYGEVDGIAKMIPTVLNITIDGALEMNSELKKRYDNDGRVMDLIDVSRKLEGLSRHASTHAAGVVISEEPIVNFVPLQKNEDVIVTQFTMNTLEELGLLKMDFLGLRTLTVMRDTEEMVWENRREKVVVDDLDLKDEKVYQMIGEGKTLGVFQLESAGMTNFMKDLKPDTLEDIIAGISLYRPGPMAEIPKYLSNKKNPEDVEYLCKELEPILSVTYGVIIYQEQVMQIVRDLAGYSLGRSDIVRRAMSKKDHKVMEEERRNFVYGLDDKEGNIIVPGCKRNGIDVNVAETIFSQMMDFASYAFNKAHAAAYAVIGYQTGYLMRYYPQEFIASMLNSFLGNTEKCNLYIRYARNEGINVLTPDINISNHKFRVNEDTIIFGLGSIKGVGENAAKEIMRVRDERGPITSIMDLAEKMNPGTINKRAFESLIKAGAFDGLNGSRAQMLAVYERVIESFSDKKKRTIEGQVSLFGDLIEDNDESHIEFPNLKEFSKKDLLSMEKKMTGMYLSGHPLDDYVERLERATSHTSSDILDKEDVMLDDITDEAHKYTESVMREKKSFNDTKVRDGEKVIIGGLLDEVSRKITRNGDMMAFIKLLDMNGEIECIVFPKTFDRYISFLEEENIVKIEGRVSRREEESPKIIVENIEFLDTKVEGTLYLRFKSKIKGDMALKALRPVFTTFKGNTPIKVYFEDENRAFMLGRDLWVDNSSNISDLLKERLGVENVKYIEN